MLLYWAGTTSLLIIYGLSFLLAPRYVGNLFIVLIAALWLSEYFPLHRYSNSLVNKLSGWGKKIQGAFVTLVLGTQVVAAGAFYFTDFQQPFSRSKEAAEFIREQKLDTLPIMGTIDFAVSPFAALLNKPIYYPERKDSGTFIIWDGKRKIPHDFGQIIPGIEKVLSGNHNRMVLITNYKISYEEAGEEILLEHDFITDSIRLDVLKRYENSMVSDEAYSIYVCEKIKEIHGNSLSDKAKKP